MEMDLICSENMTRVLEEILSTRKITINKDANVCVIEKGFPLEEGKIGIYFDMATINVLMDYLDDISTSKNEFKNIITGRCEKDELKVLYIILKLWAMTFLVEQRIKNIK